nr:LLM class flavin-dependent oxidoreductase [Moraxella boevrei]
MQLSILNLAPVRQGQSPKNAIDSLVNLAKFAENLGVARYWIAEHHNMPSLVSSATQLLIGHVLAHTISLNVGSGGVMLPNHSPLIVAEQYGTLATLYPNRVELGLGRAPGTDPMTARALRRNEADVSHNFPHDVAELQHYFGNNTTSVKAVPATNTNVPIYILGSSTSSAYLAAELGLPYAFASHFAPRMMVEAVKIYRTQFKPSQVLDKPYVIIGTNAIVADTDKNAQFLATSTYQFFLNVVRGQSNPLLPPVDNMDEIWHPHEKSMAMNMLNCSLIGSQTTVNHQLNTLKTAVNPDELMAVSYIFDEDLQKQSYTMLNDIVKNY